MSAKQYLDRVQELVKTIESSQEKNLDATGELFANCIANGGRVYLFGSGHSVIPVMDVFPRYGSFVGFYPIYDPRLMWHNIIGPGGARELLWLEQQEGYAKIILKSYPVDSRDCFLIFSHGGLNAAGIEMAMAAREKGAKVVSVSSHQNYRKAKSRHSSGNKLVDVSDIAIDNCVPEEDALVAADGVPQKFAAGSTVAIVSIAMALVADVGTRLVKKGIKPHTFVSPNVGLSPDHNERVFEEYTRTLARGK